RGALATALILSCAICISSRAVSGEAPAERIAVAGLRVKEACVKEEVRITGFAAAREEAGATLSTPGYRITEILVFEGDKVSANQELLRAMREDSTDIAGSAGKGGAASASGKGAMSLRAPIAGVVVKVNARVGDITGASSSAASLGAMVAQSGGAQADPHFLISAGTSVDLIVDIPSLYAAQIRKGAVARVVNEEGVEARGIVQAPASEVDPASQLGRGRLSIEPASALRSGQFASAIIETAKDCGVTVPLSAVTYRNGEPTVQVISDASVETRPVRTGLSDEVKIRVREGLAEGNVVAIHAGAGLRPGDKVAPIIKEADF
ncbi:MAG: efflux RND transporter periplasmic adaptor subunit, partial [Methylocystis sp.]